MSANREIFLPGEGIGSTGSRPSASDQGQDLLGQRQEGHEVNQPKHPQNDETSEPIGVWGISLAGKALPNGGEASL